MNIESMIPYDIKDPDIIHRLPISLEEISGIAYFSKNKLACIEDEHAIVYIYDLNKNKIISKYNFGKDGDYEDIAIVDKFIYVLQSNGTIIKIKNIDKKRKIKTTKINTQ